MTNYRTHGARDERNHDADTQPGRDFTNGDTAVRSVTDDDCHDLALGLIDTIASPIGRAYFRALADRDPGAVRRAVLRAHGLPVHGGTRPGSPLDDPARPGPGGLVPRRDVRGATATALTC